MKAHAWLRSLHETCKFMSVETPNKVASSSELRRWIEQGSLVINSEKITPNEEMDFPIISVVMFPKSVIRRCTLY